MDIQEIIDLLEKANEGTTLLPHKAYYRVNPDKYNQALTLLKQQPKATSIGNKIREIANKDILGQTKLVRDKDILNQAADRLDAWWKYIGELKVQIKVKDELLFAYESVRAPKQPTAGELIETRIFEAKIWVSAKDWNKLRARLDRAKATNKDLLEALEKYGRHGVVGGDICEKSKHSDYNCTCGFEVAIAKAKK